MNVKINKHVGRVLWSFILLFATLIVGIYNQQITKANHFDNLSTSNFTRTTPVEAPRGNIYDRHYKPLAVNRFLFHAFIVSNTKSNQTRNKIIETCLGQSALDILLKAPQRKHCCLKKNLTLNEISCLQQNKCSDMGIIIQRSNTRHYPCTPAIKRIIGETGYATQESFSQRALDPGYLSLPFSSIGISGLELTHDHTLRGQCGSTTHIVNAKEQVLSHAGDSVNVTPGQPLLTTINSELQSHIANLLKKAKKAHAIVLHIPSGEILAMVSHNDTEMFTNTLTSGLFPPGSAFKIIPTLAALESEHNFETMSVDCKGGFKVGRHTFQCWKEGGHGPSTDLEKAFAVSCNVFFYQLALKLGPSALLSAAHRLGLTSQTGVDLPWESSSKMPKFSETFEPARPWFKGDTALLGIGQGRLAMTPIQIVNMLCTAVRGYAICPHIIQTANTQKNICVSNSVRKKLIDLLISGVQKGATGQAAYINQDGWETGGKTSTIQISQARVPQKDLPEHLRCHSLFVGFLAHKKEPVFAILVLGENEMWGAGFASHTAQAIFQQILDLHKKKKLL